MKRGSDGSDCQSPQNEAAYDQAHERWKRLQMVAGSGHRAAINPP